MPTACHFIVIGQSHSLYHPMASPIISALGVYEPLSWCVFKELHMVPDAVQYPGYDLVIIDLDFIKPKFDGLTYVQDLRRLNPGTKIVAVTYDQTLAEQVFRLGMVVIMEPMDSDAVGDKLVSEMNYDTGWIFKPAVFAKPPAG